MGAVSPILLDGAMGTELRRRGVRVPSHVTSIWSAQALLDDPAAVRAVHGAYIDAGADVITTNSYAVVPALLAKEGLEERLDELLLTACDLAEQARSGAVDRAPVAATRIAGSLPPLDISYRHDLVGPEATILATYRRLAALLAPRVDLILCETLSTALEARAAARAALETGRPTWLSFTLQGRSTAHLPDGTPLSVAARAIADLPVEAVLVNCCATDAVTPALGALRSALGDGIRIGAYANNERRPADPEGALEARPYAEIASGWRAQGASILGGCCGTTPDHIARLRAVLDGTPGGTPPIRP